MTNSEQKIQNQMSIIKNYLKNQQNGIEKYIVKNSEGDTMASQTYCAVSYLINNFEEKRKMIQINPKNEDDSSLLNAALWILHFIPSNEIAKRFENYFTRLEQNKPYSEEEYCIKILARIVSLIGGNIFETLSKYEKASSVFNCIKDIEKLNELRFLKAKLEELKETHNMLEEMKNLKAAQ